MNKLAASLALLTIIISAAGCGGMVKAVGVVPNSADQLCRDTRPPERWKECQPGG